MLVHLAIGDAYGAAFEFASPKFVRSNNKLRRYLPPNIHDGLAGRYTDDTQMCLAMVEHIIEDGDWTRQSIADRLLKAFHRDPRPGYHWKLLEPLSSSKNGKQLLSRVSSQINCSSVAGRVLPIGLFPREDDIVQRAQLQALVTHDNSSAVNACVAVALATHYIAVPLGDMDGLLDYLRDTISYDPRPRWESQVPDDASLAARAAIQHLTDHQQLSQMLLAAVDQGGDTDVVAAIAIGLASMSPEIEDDLPNWMWKNFDATEYGKKFIIQLESKLEQKLAALRDRRKGAN